MTRKEINGIVDSGITNFIPIYKNFIESFNISEYEELEII